MNRSPLQTLFTQGLTAFFQKGRLSRRQIGIVALGIIGLLYTVLLTSVDHSASAAQAPALPQQSTTATPVPADALGPEFMTEFQRLSAAPTDSAATSADTTAAIPGSFGGSLIMALVLVLGLAYAALWGYKQFILRPQNSDRDNSTFLSIQETQSLGTAQKLHLVRLGEEMLLLGATDHNITLLARYGAEQFEQPFDEHLKAAQSATTSQSSLLQSVPLQESLQALRNVQHGHRGGKDA